MYETGAGHQGAGRRDRYPEARDIAMPFRDNAVVVLPGGESPLP